MSNISPPQPTKKESSGCLKWLALPFAILLVIVLPLALLAFDVGRVVFNRPLVKSIVTDEVVNSDLIPAALEWFSDRRAQQRVASGEALTGIREPDIVLLMSYLDAKDWRAIKEEVLPDEILTEWTSITVDGTYDWIDSDDRVPQISWSLRSFKDRVNTQHGVNAIVIAYDNIAPCTQEEIEDFKTRLDAAPPGTDVLYNLCEFPDPWHEDQFSDYVNSLHEVVANIVDEFYLTEELSRIADTAGVGPEVLKAQLRLIRLLMLYAWVAPFALLMILLLLVVRSLRTLSRWCGLPLLVGGFVTLLPPLVYRYLITSLLATGPLSEAPELITQEATRAILRLAAHIFQPMLIQAIVVTGVGLLLVIWMTVTKKRAAEQS